MLYLRMVVGPIVILNYHIHIKGHTRVKYPIFDPKKTQSIDILLKYSNFGPLDNAK